MHCENCGAVLDQNAQVCPSCGTATGTLHGGPDPADPLDTQPNPEGFVWEAHTPVVTSSIAMKQLVAALGAGIFFVAILMGILDFSAMVSLIPALIGVFFFLVVLGFIVAFVLHAGTGGGPMATFAVIREGVGYKAGSVSEKINLATLGGSVITGSLAGAGGSLINISREMDFIPWKEVRSVTARTSDRSIVVYRQELVNPVAVYCTQENFELVTSMVSEYAPPGTFRMKRW